jgi:WD40 repeat protein
MNLRRTFLSIVFVSILVVSSSAQQPMPKAPVFPPIVPAQARPDGVAGGLEGPSFGIAWSEELGLVIAACENQALCYWHKDVTLGVRPGDGAANVAHGHTGPVTCVVAAGSVVASAGYDGKVLIWNLPAEKVLQTLNAGGHVRGLAISHDGKTLASVGEDAKVQLWDVATGKAGAKLNGAADWLLSIAFSPDGKTLAAGSIDGHVHLYDVAAGKKTLDVIAVAPPPANQPAPTPSAVTALEFAPDGKSIAAGCADGQVYLFQTDGKFIRVMTGGHASAVTGVTFHPTGTLLVSSSKDRTIKLWTPANGQLVKALEGHTAWVQGVTFIAEGTRLASAGADGTVRFWDLTDPAKK